ncbi:flavin reductase family protein [Pararhodobacter sp. CCB-MM2]|uniref:flavin reductase family protein n=1 Tax=Pararhodobacter sp. CCB-MM2 TaxID=1786003 RepID=UPI0018F29FBC|nr:flavin reductase family protein [Pararhodobacter sp. CCB-MM2]MCA2010299.1 flavin reductase family protein [Cereibacter sphaeroides]
MSVDPGHFRSAMARFPGAVTIITTQTPQGRRGITATAVCSVTADPPSLLVCVNRATGTCQGILETGRFAVNLLAGPSGDMAMRFAGVGGATGEEKFAMGDWRSDAMGLPVLADALVAFSCEVAESSAAGTHQVFIGQITDISQSAGAALLYEQSRFHKLAPL